MKKETKDILLKFAGALWAISTSYYALQQYYHVNTFLWILASILLFIWFIRFTDKISEIKKPKK